MIKEENLRKLNKIKPKVIATETGLDYRTVLTAISGGRVSKATEKLLELWIEKGL